MFGESIHMNFNLPFIKCFLATILLGQYISATQLVLENYTKSNRIWMGLKEALIEPVYFEVIESQVAGEIEIVANDGMLVKENTHLVTINPKQLALDENSLKLEEEKYLVALEKIENEGFEREQKLQKALEDAEAAKIKLADLKLNLASNDEFHQLKSNILIAENKIEKRIERLKSQLSPDALGRDIEIKKRELFLALEAQRNQIIISRRRAQLRAKEQGQFLYSQELKEIFKRNSNLSRKAWVEPGTQIARIENRNQYTVKIVSTDELLDRIPQDQMMVMVKSKSAGKLIRANFSSIEFETLGLNSNTIYKFEIKEGDSKDISVSSTRKEMVHLFQLFEEPCFIVPKRDLVLDNTISLMNQGWSVLVKRLWKQAEVLAVAPQHLAIRLANESDSQ